MELKFIDDAQAFFSLGFLNDEACDMHQQELLTRFSLSDGGGCSGDQTGPARDREE